MATEALKIELGKHLKYKKEIIESFANGSITLTHGLIYKLEDGFLYNRIVAMRTSLEETMILQASNNDRSVKAYLKECIYVSGAITDIRQYMEREEKLPLSVFFTIIGTPAASAFSEMFGLLVSFYFYNGWKAVMLTGQKKGKVTVPEVVCDFLRCMNMRHVQVWSRWGITRGYEENSFDTARVYAENVVAGIGNFVEEARDFSSEGRKYKRVYDVFVRKYKDYLLSNEYF